MESQAQPIPKNIPKTKIQSGLFSKYELEIIDKLDEQKARLQAYFKERDEIIETMFISILAKQHVCMVGPPGTAKSYLITSFCKGFGFNVFQYQLSKFTTPEEILGPYSLKSLKEGKYERIKDGKLQRCDVAYLDEVFNGNSSILNKMNEIMNERMCEGESIPLESIFSGTNFIPEDPVLVAFWDRFLFRHIVDRINEYSSFKKMLSQGLYSDDPKLAVSKSDLELLQEKVDHISVSLVIDKIVKIRHELQEEGIYPSDRRFVWAITALKAMALLNKRDEVSDDDLFILRSVLWDEKKDIASVEQIIAKTVAPALARLKEMLTQANELYKDVKSADPKKVDELPKIMESLEKLKMLHSEINETVLSNAQISDKTREMATKIANELKAKADKIKSEKLSAILL